MISSFFLSRFDFLDLINNLIYLRILSSIFIFFCLFIIFTLLIQLALSKGFEIFAFCVCLLSLALMFLGSNDGNRSFLKLCSVCKSIFVTGPRSFSVTNLNVLYAFFSTVKATVIKIFFILCLIMAKVDR